MKNLGLFIIYLFSLQAEAVPGKITSPVVPLEQLCVANYSATVRPSSSYTNKIKKKLIIQINTEEMLKGYPLTKIQDYELDHKVPLSIGGDPSSLDNLWMERWDDAKVKDVLEVRLHKAVCKGKMDLYTAQKTFLDWGK